MKVTICDMYENTFKLIIRWKLQAHSDGILTKEKLYKAEKRHLTVIILLDVKIERGFCFH